MRPPGASRRARLRGIVQRIQEIVGARQTGPSTSRAAADAPPLRLVPARPDVHDDAGRHSGWWSPTGMDDVVLVGPVGIAPRP
jgi:hypothetical protein